MKISVLLLSLLLGACSLTPKSETALTQAQLAPPTADTPEKTALIEEAEASIHLSCETMLYSADLLRQGKTQTQHDALMAEFEKRQAPRWERARRFSKQLTAQADKAFKQSIVAYMRAQVDDCAKRSQQIPARVEGRVVSPEPSR